MVALIVGLLLGRYLLPASKAPVARSPVEPVGSARPNAEASTAVVARPSDGGTSQPGTNPPQTPAAAPAGRGLPGMPTRTNEFGIPVGYPHTEAGAISACGNYVAAYIDRHNRDASQIRKIFASIGIADATDKLSDKVISADATTVRNFGLTSINSPQMSFNIRPIGYSVQSSKKDQVVVSVWSTAGVGLYADSGKLVPQQSWGTDICTVAWSDADWKLSDAGDGPNGPSITEQAAEGFERFIYVGRPAQ